MIFSITNLCREYGPNVVWMDGSRTIINDFLSEKASWIIYTVDEDFQIANDYTSLLWLGWDCIWVTQFSWSQVNLTIIYLFSGSQLLKSLSYDFQVEHGYSPLQGPGSKCIWMILSKFPRSLFSCSYNGFWIITWKAFELGLPNAHEYSPL